MDRWLRFKVNLTCVYLSVSGDCVYSGCCWCCPVVGLDVYCTVKHQKASETRGGASL